MDMLKPQSAKDRIIIALDVDTIDETVKFTELLKDYAGFFKVGLPLCISCSFKSVEAIKEHGGNVYFDGKFQDIPNTVAKACVNLMKKGVDFFNISCTGGSKMMVSTVEACNTFAKKNNLPMPTILGSTLLSSFGQKTLTNELCVEKDISAYVLHLARTAKEAGLSGVIAPDTDAAKIKKELGEDFIVVCPAVRPTWAIVNDQIRIVSPSDAIKAGADYIIVGRPIIQAQDPVSAAKLIIAEIEEALNEIAVNK